MIWNLQRTYRPLTWFAATLLLMGVLATTALAERPPAARLLPERTVALLSVTDAPDMSERFMNTAMGRMSQDPQLQPLVGQLYGSVLEATAEMKDRIGLSLPELLAIPQGELTLAVVTPEDRPPALVALLDAGNQLSNARKLLARGTDELDRSEATRSEETVAGTKFTIYDGVGPQRRKAIYFEKDATIVIGSDLDVLKQLLAVWNGEKAATLSDNQSFGAIMNRCRGAKDEKPQVIWYADPVGIMRGIGQQQTSVRMAVTVLPVLGLDGLSAIGGSLILDTEQFDSVMHAHVLLESPRSGVIKMIALESGDVTPESWVPADVASYTTLHWNVEKTYTTLATVYDSFRGEGALASAMERRILGPTGIDFEKEILQSLEGRMTMITRIERPITVRSQGMLLGLKLEDADAVEKALKKVAESSNGALARETYAGKAYYQVRAPQLEELPEDQRPPMPCFGVLDDYLLAANQLSLYKQVVTTAADGSKSLADELDFKLVAGKIKRQSGGNAPAMISFERPEESMRFLYELATGEQAREGLRGQAENNPFLKSVETALQEHPLPPFAVLRRYLAPGGAMVVDDETGIHYTAFSLRRKPD